MLSKLLESKMIYLCGGLILLGGFEIFRLIILSQYDIVDSFIRIFYTRLLFIILLGVLIALYFLKFKIREHLILSVLMLAFLLYTGNLIVIEGKEASAFYSLIKNTNK